MKKTIALSLSLTLAACGGGGGGSSANPGTTPTPQPDNGYMIKSFAISSAIASPYINNGFFSLSWSVNTFDSSYNVTGYLSDNDTYSPADQKLFAKTCGSVASDCGNVATEKTECKYTNTNTLECPGEITPLNFDKLPHSAYIILRSCKGVVTFDCDTKASPITFE